MAATVVHRFPKDFGATLMTAASVDALLFLEGKSSSYAFEKAVYGTFKPEFALGRKTIGTMVRNRSGMVVVSPRRLAEWEARQPAIVFIARSILWEMLRRPRVLTFEELFAMEPVTQKAVIAFMYMLPAYNRRRSDESLFLTTCACAHLDSIAALWCFLLEAADAGNTQLAFTCARYLPPAVALVGAQPFGRRIAALIFARLRQECLDQIRYDGYSLDLAGYDVESLFDSAEQLPALELHRPRWLKSTVSVKWPVTTRQASSMDVLVSAERAMWIQSHLAPIRRSRGRRLVWRKDVSPTHRLEASSESGRFSPAAIARFRETLREFS
jgi:hypothetical protein